MDQTRVVELCQRMTTLMADPHPGLFTWNEACERTAQELKEALGVEQRAAPMPQEVLPALVKLYQDMEKKEFAGTGGLLFLQVLGKPVLTLTFSPEHALELFALLEKK